MPGDRHVDFTASLCRDFNGIRELCCSTNVAVPENTNGVFSLSLQNLNEILKHHSAMAAKVHALEHVHGVEENAAAWLASWTSGED